MGQANSRRRNSHSPAEPASTAVSDPSPQEPLASSSSTPTDPASPDTLRPPKRSRRASLRRSILGLVPSSSSSRITKEGVPASSGEGSQSQSLRKRWRSSRRFSKAPPQLADLAEPTSQESGASSGDREVICNESTAAPISEGATGTQSSTNPNSSPSPAPTPRSSLPSTSGSAHLDKQQADPIPVASSSSSQGPSSSTRHADIQREVTEFLSGRADDSGVASTSDTNNSPYAPRVEAESTNQQQQPRHITQPSTLVIVQGVVNTTDTPHASTSSASTSHAQPQATSSTRPSSILPSSTAAPVPRRRASSVTLPRSDERRRSRLHSFIRPTSMLGRPTPDSSSQASLAQTSESSASPSTSPAVIDSSEATDAQASAPEASAASQSENASSSRGLSPGSIDVLGTLLSVAAAATAASLLSPGFHHSNTSDSTSPDTSTTSATLPVRPLSPTPTAGLGALGGLGGLAGLGLASPSTTAPLSGTPQDSRDRIRNVWENIRERVGLNSRNPGAPAERHGEDTTPLADRNPRMRPGEMMLAEMARALNAGLGLAPGTERRQNSESSSTEPASNGPVVFPPSQGSLGQLPPEGSFERFLVNLQVDLRTLLSTDEPASNPSQQPAPDGPASSPAANSNEDPEHAASSSTPQPTAQHAEVVDTEEPPPLEDVSDSEDGNDGITERQRATDETAPQVNTRTPTPIPLSGSLPFGPGGHGEQEAPRPAHRHAHTHDRPAINLWRLYRFEPIRADQAQEHALRTTQTHAAQAGAIPPLVSPVASPVPPTEPSAGVSGASATPTPAPEQNTNTNPGNVIPVIVVGLQSVDVAEPDEPEEDMVMPSPIPQSVGTLPASEAGSSQEDPLGNLGNPSTTRGRTWQSRAANAFRTLRTSRRSSRTRRNQDGPGSRTFLIYVIGGYYPPNHHMVTGPDNLDSYEALWELAELLGQVKPPTATRTDIDNSGLQIIKASELSQYEQDGKISSNCTDRCLVCLDDYEPTDDVRVMSCRHAFHKDCVDKWLQVGRNNCPACRTKGVSVPETRPPTAPAETPA